MKCVSFIVLVFNMSIVFGQKFTLESKNAIETLELNKKGTYYRDISFKEGYVTPVYFEDKYLTRIISLCF